MLETVHGQLGQGYEQFAVGVLAEVLDAHIARLFVNHIDGVDAVHGYLAARDGELSHVLLAVAYHAHLHFRVLRSFQAVHSLLVGHLLAHEERVVDGHYLVAGYQSCPFGGAVADDVLHAHRVLADGELDAHARERAAQVVLGGLLVLSRDIDRVRVQLREQLGHGLLHEVGHVHRVHILVVDDVEQVLQFVGARVDDAQAGAATEVVGVESADEYAHHRTECEP